MIVLAASQRGCMINDIDFMYRKLPPEYEYLIYSEHVEVVSRTFQKLFMQYEQHIWPYIKGKWKTTDHAVKVT